MDCRDCELILVEYAMGELAQDTASDCRAHLETCPACRRELEDYRRLIGAIADEPVAVPSEAESAALAMALDRVRPCPSPAPRVADPGLQGLPAFAAACAAAFVIVAGILALHTFGAVSFAAAGAIGWGTIAVTATVIVFVTSFVPIAVTARRRPLNGMTFRR